MMASIVEIVLYTKPTAEHQYLLRSSSHSLQIKLTFPFSLGLRIRRIRDVQSRSPQQGDTTSRKFAKWTSRPEPELSINVMMLYTVQSSLFFRKIVQNERYRRPS